MSITLSLNLLNMKKIETETALKIKVMKYLKTLDNALFIKIADKFTSGLPDIIGCYNSKFMAFELKRKGKKPTKIQAHVLNGINKAGGVTEVITDLEQVKNIINNERRINNERKRIKKNNKTA
jgi:hypothetical protein